MLQAVPAGFVQAVFARSAYDVLDSAKTGPLPCSAPGVRQSNLAMNSKFSSYAHPEVLVDGAWLQDHLNDPSIRIVESNEDVLLYDTGHIPGAVHIDWRGDLQDNTERDYV